jgi:hypothetical protein
MTKGTVSNKKKLAMGKAAKVEGKAYKKGGAVKGKEVAVKHVAMKKGGKC